jgi:hypothetical protein
VVSAGINGNGGWVVIAVIATPPNPRGKRFTNYIAAGPETGSDTPGHPQLTAQNH